MINLTSHGLATPMNPSPPVNQKRSCSTDEKVIFVAVALIGILASGFVGVLHYHHPSMTFQYLPLLGGTATLSACAFVVYFYHVVLDRSDFKEQVKIEEKKIVYEESVLPIEIQEEIIQEAPLPQNPPQKMVYWATSFKSFSQPVCETWDPTSKKLIESMEKRFPWVQKEREFAWLRQLKTPSSPPAPENTQFVQTVREKLSLLLQEKWELASVGYSEGEIEKILSQLIAHPIDKDHSADDLLKDRFSWFALVPFLIRLFRALGQKRADLLPWLQEHSKELLKFGFSFVSENEELMNTEIVASMFNSFIKLIMPFNQFLTEDQKGENEVVKNLLHHFIFGVLFDLLPEKEGEKADNFYKRQIHHTTYLIEQIAPVRTHIQTTTCSIQERLLESLALLETRWKEKEKKCHAHFLIERTFFTHVLPFASEEILSPNTEHGSYLKTLEDIHSAFPTFSTFSEIDTYCCDRQGTWLLQRISFHSLIKAEHVLDSLFNELKKAKDEVIKKDFASLFEKCGEKEKWSAFETDFTQISEGISSFFQSLLSDSTKSIGEFFTKSFLISQALAVIYEQPEDAFKLAEHFFQHLLKSTQAFDLKGKDNEELPAFGKEMIEAFTDFMVLFQKKQKEEEGVALFPAIPIHDLILGAVLTLFFSCRHVHRFLPSLKKHLPLFMVFFKQLKVSRYASYAGLIETGASAVVTLLTPLNKVLLGSWPGKNTAIKMTLKPIFFTIKRFIEDDELKKTLDDLMFPMTVFLLVGTFGRDSKEKNAFQAYETALTSLYRSLYQFDVRKAVENFSEFSQDLEKKLSIFFNPINPTNN